MSARIILRKRISDDEGGENYQEIIRLLRSRADGKGEDVAELLARYAEVMPHGKGGISNKFFQVWGFVEPDGDIEEARALLLEDRSLLVEVIPPEDGQDDERDDRDDKGEAPPDDTPRQAPRDDTPRRVRPDIRPRRAPPYDFLGPLPSIPRVGTDDEIAATGVDLRLEIADASTASQHFGRRRHRAPVFGTAANAMHLVGANWAGDGFYDAPAGQDGLGVNVIIADTGFSRDYLSRINPNFTYGGGFTRFGANAQVPGEIGGNDPSHHGNMIARNVMRIAPRATFYDAPILPGRIFDTPQYSADLEHLYLGIWNEITEEDGDLFHLRDAPWIIVNAWAVVDTTAERSLPIEAAGIDADQYYSDGAAHPLRNVVADMAERITFIFAAGNCGQFEPQQKCGLYNTGPRRGIVGLNAYEQVITVGATDITDKWIGASGQGPGPATLDPHEEKPDLVAPAWFCENDDRKTTNTGSSAACAVAAGLVASLRTGEIATPDKAALVNRLTQAGLPKDWVQRVRDGGGLARL